jgi:CheY-like chemotaxis protein
MRDFGVLVVDDDSDMLSSIKRMFNSYRIKVDCAASASAALDSLKIRDYKTMITDLEMPDMDGLELARKARELFPDLNVILVTGNRSPHVLNLAIEAKVSEVHFKPFYFNDILTCIMNKETGKTFI